jgi:hypothetical protein
MHRAAVTMLQDNPALKLRLLDTLARWQLRQGPWAQTLCDAWVEIISQSDWVRALEQSERGNQLRQASPLATILPNSVRYGIIRQVRALKNKSEMPHA